MRCAVPVVAALLLAAVFTAHAQELPGGEPDAPGVVETVDPQAQPPAVVETEGTLHDRGLASWYGPRFHGRRTASGERFDMHALTAAHPSLPFGTVVQVRSLVDGRSVDVRINDRGPHIKRRIIDLSRAAAHALGMLGPGGGLKEVVVRIIKQPKP